MRRTDGWGCGVVGVVLEEGREVERREGIMSRSPRNAMKYRPIPMPSRTSINENVNRFLFKARRIQGHSIVLRVESGGPAQI